MQWFKKSCVKKNKKKIEHLTDKHIINIIVYMYDLQIQNSGK